MSIGVVAYQRYYYNVTLLPLETINGIDGQQMAERLEENILLYKMTQIVYLCAIWGYYSDVYALVENTALAYFSEVCLQHFHYLVGFWLVHSSEGLTDKCLATIAFVV